MSELGAEKKDFFLLFLNTTSCSASSSNIKFPSSLALSPSPSLSSTSRAFSPSIASMLARQGLLRPRLVISAPARLTRPPAAAAAARTRMRWRFRFFDVVGGIRAFSSSPPCSASAAAGPRVGSQRGLFEGTLRRDSPPDVGRRGGAGLARRGARGIRRRRRRRRGGGGVGGDRFLKGRLRQGELLRHAGPVPTVSSRSVDVVVVVVCVCP